MIQASLLEQITTFFNILVANQYLNIIAIAAVGLILILILASKFHNKKITKILYIVAYLGIFGTLIGFFHKEILELFDYLINNIFLFLFFPNLAVYILVLVIVNILIIKSTFSEKDNKGLKIFNIISFIIFNIIFYLIIDNVIENNVNVYEQLSIYTNNDLLILVELSMKLFVVWLLMLGIIKITRSLVGGVYVAKSTNKNLNLVKNSNELELQNLKVMEVIPEVLDKEEEKVPESHNKFNDYLDIVPMKKQMKMLTDNFRISDVPETKIEQLEEDIQDTALTEVITKVNPFDNIKIENNQDTLVITNEEEKVEPKITLSSYDSIFKVHDEKLETNIDKSMEVVFDDNNYLQNILLDIEDLKNNMQDEEKIKKIYDEVKFRENELTLSDYNYLINQLITIKK